MTNAKPRLEPEIPNPTGGMVVRPPTDDMTSADPFRVAAGLVVIDGERAADFEDFRRRLEQRIHVDDVLACYLVARLAELLWRLQRSSAFEAGLLSWVAHQQAMTHDRSGATANGHFFPGDPQGLEKPKRHAVPNVVHRRRVGRVVEATLSNADLLGRIGRYEAHPMRQVEKTIAELRRMGAVFHQCAEVRKGRSHEPTA